MNEAWRENLSAANAERARVGEVLKGSGAASAQLAGIGDLQSDSLGRLRMSSERAAEKMVEKEGVKDFVKIEKPARNTGNRILAWFADISNIFVVMFSGLAAAGAGWAITC